VSSKTDGLPLFRVKKSKRHILLKLGKNGRLTDLALVRAVAEPPISLTKSNGHLTNLAPHFFWHTMRKKRIYTCEIKRHRLVAPALCAVCPRIHRCRSFRAWYQGHKREYVDFVVDIVKKFPEKYEMEVIFMAEKQQYIQIVDTATGAIERITTMTEINAMSVEDKLALSKDKTLFMVTHRIEPIVTVTLKRHAITSKMEFNTPTEAEPEETKPAAKTTKKKK